ncbi:MAG: hypothetical protein ACRDYA_17870, partial [Egibacteraceae bacterium]
DATGWTAPASSASTTIASTTRRSLAMRTNYPAICVFESDTRHTPDSRRLIVVQTNTALLLSVDAAATGVVRTIDAGGVSLECSDGLLRHGHTLYAVQGALHQISVVNLSSSYASGA